MAHQEDEKMAKENILNDVNDSFISENLTEDEKIQELKRRNSAKELDAQSVEYMAEQTKNLEKGHAFDLGHLEEEEEYKSPFDLVDLPKNYDNYVKLHTGNYIKDETFEEKKDALAKSLAAMNVQETRKSFSLKEIHKQAEKNKDIYNLNELTKAEVDKALKNPQNLEKFRASRIKNQFAVKPGDEETYINKMKTLHQNMMSKTDRTAAYVRFYDNVAKIAALDPKDPKIKAKLAIANRDLVTSIDNYYSDKKTVRWGKDGQKRFNNCVDSMAIVAKHVPGSEPLMETYVVRINAARDAYKAKNFDKAISLGAYGEERAVLHRDPKNIRELEEKELKKKKDNIKKEKAKKELKSEKQIENEMGMGPLGF